MCESLLCVKASLCKSLLCVKASLRKNLLCVKAFFAQDCLKSLLCVKASLRKNLLCVKAFFVPTLYHKVVLGRTLCKVCSTKEYWVVLCASFVEQISTGKYFAQAL